MLLGSLIGLLVNNIELIRDNGHKEDFAAGEEFREIKILLDTIVTSCSGDIEEEVGCVVLGDTWKLKEDFIADTHSERFG